MLRHLALGLSNKEIAKSLSISVETVKEHVQHVLRKIGVNDRTQAAVWAVRRGIVLSSCCKTPLPSGERVGAG